MAAMATQEATQGPTSRVEALRILGLTEEETDIRRIRYAYKRLALAHHPDRQQRQQNQQLQEHRQSQESMGNGGTIDSVRTTHGSSSSSNSSSSSSSSNSSSKRSPPPSALHCDQKSDMPPSISSVLNFSQVQQAFDFLLHGLQSNTRALFKVAHGGQSISAVGEDVESVALGMGLGDEEESVTAEVTFTCCPLCLKPFKVGRALRAHFQSKSHALTATTSPLSLERAMNLAIANFTVTATSNYMVEQSSASVGLKSKGRPLLLDQPVDKNNEEVVEEEEEEGRGDGSGDGSGEKKGKRRTGKKGTKGKKKKKKHHHGGDVALERARERACTKASASAAAESVRKYGSGGGDRANAKLSHDGLTAARDGDLSTLIQLIESGAYDVVRDVGPNGETGHHWAAGSGHLNVLVYLVEIGGVEGLTKRDQRSGRTVVHWASRNGHLSLLAAIKERWPSSLDVRMRTYDGTTSLHLACYAGETATVEWLVGHGCDPNVCNNYGCNSIFFACIGGRYQTSKFLYEECSVDVFAIQNQGHSALHKAAYTGSRDICAWLQDVVGLDVNCTLEDAKGHTASDLARMKGYLELSLWLTRHCSSVVAEVAVVEKVVVEMVATEESTSGSTKKIH